MRVISRRQEVLSRSPETNTQTLFAPEGALDIITALLMFQYDMISLAINCEQLMLQNGLNLVQNEVLSLSHAAAFIRGRATGGAKIVLAIKKI